MEDALGLQPGRRIGGFLLGECIGQGGMGEVWKAQHEATGVDVAIKFVSQLPGGAGAPSGRAQSPGGMASMGGPRRFSAFEEEARALAAMNHPGIVRILDYGRTPLGVGDRAGVPYLVMERFGSTLSTDKPSSWWMLSHLLERLLEALAHVHARGLLHQDLKPSNILIARRSDGGIEPCLADFGTAWRTLGGATSQIRGGTPAYMAPEQHLGKTDEFGPWTDLYSLGCVAFELVNGARPFRGTRAQLLAQHLHQAVPPLDPIFPVPRGFEQWLKGCLAKHRGKRFRSAYMALWYLRQLSLGGVPTTAAKGPAAGVDEAPSITLGTLDTADTSSMSMGPVVRPVSDPYVGPARSTPSWTWPPLPTRWQGLVRRPPSRALAAAGVGLVAMRETPMVGRFAERDQLWETLLATASSQRPSVTVIASEPGLGKTRLLQWLAARVREVDAARVVSVTHAASDELKSLQMLVAALVDYAIDARRKTSGDGPERAGPVRLEANLVEVLKLPTLAAAAAFDWGPLEVALGQGLALEDRSLNRPVLVVVDDGHRAELLLQFLTRLIAQRSACPWMVVVASDGTFDGSPPGRPALVELLASTQSGQTVRLAPLKTQEMHELASAIVGLASPAVASLVRFANGRPAALQQSIARLAVEGVWRTTPDGYTIEDDDLRQRAEFDGDPLALAVWANEPSLRVPLAVLAALGDVAATDEWLAACALLGLDGPAMADELARSGLVTVGGDVVRFKASGSRRTLLGRSDVTPSWAEIHAACAEVIAESPRASLRDERMGLHYAKAGRWEAALEPLLRGAQQRMITTNYADALGLVWERERVLSGLGQGSRSVAWRQGELVRLLSQSSPESSLKVAQRLLEDGEGMADATAVEAHRMVAWATRETGGPTATVIAHATKAVEIGRSVGDGVGAARARMLVAGTFLTTRRYDEARREFEQARSDFKALGDELGHAATCFGLAEVELGSGRLGLAGVACEEGLAVAEKLVYPYDQARGRMIRVAITLATAEGVASRSIDEDLRAAVDLAQSCGLTMLLWRAQLLAAQVHLERGDWLDAERVLSWLARAPEADRCRVAIVLGRVAAAARVGDMDAVSRLWAMVPWATSDTRHREDLVFGELASQALEALGDPRGAIVQNFIKGSHGRTPPTS